MILGLSAKWIRSVFRGPVSITYAELVKLEDPKTLPNQWVTFSFSGAIDSGLGIETTNNHVRTKQTRFLLVPVEDRWLIVEVPEKFTGRTVTGYLRRGWAVLQKQTVEAVKANHPAKSLLPYEMDAEYDQKGQCYTMFAILGVFGLIGVGTRVGGLVKLLTPSR